jgi:hypothetical protein
MGNRGILHDEHGVLGSARWRHKNWVACALSFKDRRRTVMAPGKYTELFFCDEAVALAAGHRPCCECRRADYERFMRAWQRAHDLPTPPRSGAVDDALHRARVTRDRRQVRTPARIGSLPDGAMLSLPEEPGTAWLVWQGSVHRWSHEGYSDRRALPSNAAVLVLTPGPTLRALVAGYRPAVHPTQETRA